MASNCSTTQQSNELTPMAFLPPDVAYQATIAAYVMVGSVGALIWDILMNIDKEYRLLFKYKFTMPTFTYFLSRASVLVYVLGNIIFQTAQLPNCEVIKKTICVLYHVAFSSTALLFFLRVRAVFNRDKYIVAFFSILWLSVLAGSLTVASVGDAVHIGPTQYCRAIAPKPYASAAPITFAIHDTFVFLAISWQLTRNAQLDPKRKQDLKYLVLGEYLPRFSRSLLQDGQIYYLVSVTSNILVVILTFTKKVPSSYRLMFTVFNIAITNMMACRVHRRTKFGNFTEDVSATAWIASQIRRIGTDLGPIHFSPSCETPANAALATVVHTQLPLERKPTNSTIGGIEGQDDHPIEKSHPVKSRIADNDSPV